MASRDVHPPLPKLVRAQLLTFGLAALPAAGMACLVLRSANVGSLAVWALILVVLFGVAGPYAIISHLLHAALAASPRDGADAKLSRLLHLPVRLEVELLGCYLGGVALGVGGYALARGEGLASVPWAMSCFGLLALVAGVRQRVAFERALRPLALEAFRHDPSARPRSRYLPWPSVSWYLPYSFVVFALAVAVNVVAVLRNARPPGAAHGSTAAELLAQVQTGALASTRSLAVALGLLGAYLLAVALAGAFAVAHDLELGARIVGRSLASLGTAAPAAPAWISGGALGELSRETVLALGRFQGLSGTLRDTVQTLEALAAELEASARAQDDELSHEASTLHQAHSTAEEIQQTSVLAARKAESLLEQIQRADALSRSGETAIRQSLEGLRDIQRQVSEMATRIHALDDRARQIAHITTTVKDLADQSNMLALNAAIEAVRSGQHGQGFGVVAREIRSLADQSIQATHHVREILQDISEAIRSTVRITRQGSERVESSLEEVRAFGDRIRQLSGIVRDSASSVRQISAAVSQQNAGVALIFESVNDLTRMMERTQQRLRASEDAARLARKLAERVSGSIVGASGEPERVRVTSPEEPEARGALSSLAPSPTTG